MSRFKKITHVVAAGFAVVVGFAVSPAGQAIVSQYPKTICNRNRFTKSMRDAISGTRSDDITASFGTGPQIASRFSANFTWVHNYQFYTIRIILAICAILFLYSVMGVFLFGQEKFTPDWPMPPDILNAKPSCELLEYESGEVLNAKTQEVEQMTRWLVMPVATYADHRPRWTLPEETLPTNLEIKHPGAIANVATAHEAIDTCQAWMKAVKARVKDLKQQNQKEKAQ